MHMSIDKELFHSGPKQDLRHKAEFERHKAEFNQTAGPFAIVNGFEEITWNTDRFLFLGLLILYSGTQSSDLSVEAALISGMCHLPAKKQTARKS